MVSLDKRLSKCGLAIIAFPCNQFGAQEPGTNSEIKDFVKRFGVKFQMMGKVDVNGEGMSPVWKELKQVFPGVTRWNFATKFLVARNGTAVSRFDGTHTRELTPVVSDLVCADTQGCCE